MFFPIGISSKFKLLVLQFAASSFVTVCQEWWLGLVTFQRLQSYSIQTSINRGCAWLIPAYKQPDLFYPQFHKFHVPRIQNLIHLFG